MKHSNRITRLATSAAAFPLALVLALVVGCGGDEGPGYLPKDGEAPPLSADAQAAAAAEDRAVAEEERAAAAQDLPKSGRKSAR